MYIDGISKKKKAYENNTLNTLVSTKLHMSFDIKIK